MGSVKDLEILEPAFENKPGTGRFHFSDRYSVFDFGEMPDHILNKGAALAIQAALNFENIHILGIPSHYCGLVQRFANNDSLIRTIDVGEGSNGLDTMQVDMAVVYKPIVRRFMENGQPKLHYDYSFYNANRGSLNNFLIPLEMIFRNGLPRGSSVFGRIEEAKKIENPDERESKLSHIYTELGVSSEPKPGDMLPKPIINYTTKLESGDRALSETEAYEISGLKMEDFRKLHPLILRVDEYITERAEKTGLGPHWDGKVEMRFIDDRLELVDVLGTLDEDRFGPDISKELVRQWYKKNQPEFVDACKEWKKTGEGWQKRCPIKPVNLPADLVRLVSQMYMSAANQYVERRIFQTPELARVMEDIAPYR